MRNPLHSDHHAPAVDGASVTIVYRDENIEDETFMITKENTDIYTHDNVFEIRDDDGRIVYIPMEIVRFAIRTDSA